MRTRDAALTPPGPRSSFAAVQRGSAFALITPDDLFWKAVFDSAVTVLLPLRELHGSRSIDTRAPTPRMHLSLSMCAQPPRGTRGAFEAEAAAGMSPEVLSHMHAICRRPCSCSQTGRLRAFGLGGRAVHCRARSDQARPCRGRLGTRAKLIARTAMSERSARCSVGDTRTNMCQTGRALDPAGRSPRGRQCSDASQIVESSEMPYEDVSATPLSSWHGSCATAPILSCLL
jgi:hypothetical protein